MIILTMMATDDDSNDAYSVDGSFNDGLSVIVALIQ